MEFRKMVTITLYARQQKREGKGGMIQENSIETCILPYVKQMTSASWIHEARHSKQCSGTTQRHGVGRAVRGSGWGTRVPLGDSSMYGRASMVL